MRNGAIVMARYRLCGPSAICSGAGGPRGAAGRHKARVFRSRLGITAGDARQLRQVLLDAAHSRQKDLRPADADEFGQRYVLDFPMSTAVGTAMIRLQPANG